MANLFFPGDTRFGQMNRRNRCLWREEAFLLKLIGQALLPRLSIQKCLQQWAKISFDLRERQRKRTLQIAEIEVLVNMLS